MTNKVAHIENILVIIFALIVIISLANVQIKLYEINEKVNTMELDTMEIWKNIDAISEDYTQLYQEIYKEVE